MTLVGWLMDKPPYIGGAELTAQEFRDAAPDHVEVVDCPAGKVLSGLDRYVVHNHMHYSVSDLAVAQPAIRYHHDIRTQHLHNAKMDIYCSPLQLRAKAGYYYDEGDSVLIPPALDLTRYESNGAREGNVWLGRFWSEKGADLAREWAKDKGGIDFYGDGPEPPADGTFVRLHEAVPYEQVPEVLARYKTFVHLPKAIEPFGRSVVEAWASGCELVVNKNVGAMYWIEEAPEYLESAASDFWEAVLA